MITPEYLEKLNEAIPEGGMEIGVLMLKEKVIASLSKGEEEIPPLGDPNAQTVNVIVSKSWRGIKLLRWYHVNSYLLVACINDLLKAMGINVPDNELHYVWRFIKVEAQIHLGEENIDRAIHEIGVRMILNYMKEDILDRVFNDCDYTECNYELFGDPNNEDRSDEDSYYNVTIPTEIDLEQANELYKLDAAKEMRKQQQMKEDLERDIQNDGGVLTCRLEGFVPYLEERMKRLQSRNHQRVLLPALKTRFLHNAKAMISKERLTFNETTCDENNSPFLSMPSEMHNKILLYLGLHCANDLLQFGLASKYCYKMFCNVLLAELGINRKNKDGDEEIIRIHDFEGIFEGMSLHLIGFSYDELDLFNAEMYPPYSISIEKYNENQGEEKLKVKYFY